MQVRLRPLRERWDLESGCGNEVGHVGPCAARNCIDANPAARAPAQPMQGGVARRCGPGQGGRHVEELVQTIDPGDPVLLEDRGGHRVRSGQMTGVRLGHGRALGRASDLDGNDGHLLACGVIGRQLQ